MSAQHARLHRDKHGPGGHVVEVAELEAARLSAVGLREFLTLTLPSREAVLAPWMLQQSLSMVYAWRGVGKTYFAIGIAYAIATGGRFLQWHARTARPVLFLDGEMPANALQERFAAAVAGGESEPSAELLHVVTPDLQPGIMPDLATAQGQEAIDEVIERLKTEVIIVDNLSAWVRGTGRENEAESWQPVAGWALRHRHAGRSILFVHHAGKGGAQRGTSKKEDLLDTVICLKRPPDYLPADGAVFEVHFEKARALYGSEAEGFEARLTIDNQGRQLWTCRTLETSTSDRVVELANSGLTQKEIAEELGINKSTVCRHYNRAQTEGRIDARRRTG